MKRSLRIIVPTFAVLLLLLFAISLSAFAQGDNGQGPDKGPLDKVVFVHYPKGLDPNAKPSKPQGGGGSGVLSPSYKYSGVHWGDPNGANDQGIPYWINPANSSQVATPDVVIAVEASFQTWQGANTSGRLSYVDAGTTTSAGAVLDSANTVSWWNISASYPNAIAVTTVWYYRFTKEIAEFDLVFNDAFRWSYTAPNVTGGAAYADPANGGVANTYDIRDIGTHEAGHTLMLNDLYNSRDNALTMYGYGSTSELKKDTLGYGDVRGLNAVYP
ncbi:MAG: hypothetical protein M1358_12790 [Chloroflexi bacterium]|nr:hypothetical protein [Chloroflexota bacterium]